MTLRRYFITDFAFFEIEELIKRDLSDLEGEDQKEILEIAGDLFTPEELKAMFAVDLAGKGEKS